MPSQLKIPIRLDPEETLPQRLPKPITDFSVKLNLMSKVSGAFPDRPENHLQIVVTLRGKRINRHFFI